MNCTITGYGSKDKIIAVTDARTGKTSPYIIQSTASTNREGTRRIGFFTYGAPDLVKIMAYCRVFGAKGDLVNCEWWDNRTGNSARLLDEQESQQFIRRSGNYTGVCFAMIDVQ